MGHNLDLIKMFGVSDKLTCNHCNQVTETYFDDYDIDCGTPNIKNGVWELDYYCEHCDKESTYKFKINIVEIN